MHGAQQVDGPFDRFRWVYRAHAGGRRHLAPAAGDFARQRSYDAVAAAGHGRGVGCQRGRMLTSSEVNRATFDTSTPRTSASSMPMGTPGLRRYVARRFAYEGHRTVEADCAADALRLLAAGPPPDLVITDVMMPGIDCIEMLGRCAATPARPACR